MSEDTDKPSPKWCIFPDGDHFAIVQVPPEVERLAQQPYFSAIFRVFFDNQDDAYRMAEDIERYVGAQWIHILNHIAKNLPK